MHFLSKLNFNGKFWTGYALLSMHRVNILANYAEWKKVPKSRKLEKKILLKTIVWLISSLVNGFRNVNETFSIAEAAVVVVYNVCMCEHWACECLLSSV